MKAYALAVAGLVLCAASALADHHRTHPIPAAEQGVLVVVRPGQQIFVTVTFSASWENCVQIYDCSSGRMLAVWNNYDGGGGCWLSEKNTTNTDQVLLLVGRHKNSPPDGRKPWILSPFRFFGSTETSLTVGWEDGADQDYDDAMAVIRLLK